MERDFWNRVCLLGHMTLLVPPMKGLMIMTTLAAKGYTTDGVPVYLWAYGNYRYEVEVKKLNFSECIFPDLYLIYVTSLSPQIDWNAISGISFSSESSHNHQTFHGRD